MWSHRQLAAFGAEIRDASHIGRYRDASTTKRLTRHSSIGRNASRRATLGHLTNGNTMWYRLSIAASAVLIMGTITANAAELPTYEVGGFPASPSQIAILGAACAQERASESAGMSASPVQI